MTTPSLRPLSLHPAVFDKLRTTHAGIAIAEAIGAVAAAEALCEKLSSRYCRVPLSLESLCLDGASRRRGAAGSAVAFETAAEQWLAIGSAETANMLRGVAHRIRLCIWPKPGAAR